MAAHPHAEHADRTASLGTVSGGTIVAWMATGRGKKVARRALNQCRYYR
jgi:hypothetical protein